MDHELKIAIAQISPSVGDIKGNVARIRDAYAKASELGADLVVYCELVVCGYPPEDLVQKGSFQRACVDAVNALAMDTADGGPAMIIGSPWPVDGRLYNAAFLLQGGRIEATRFKVRLPNYGVFDEPRRFTPGADFPAPIAFRGLKIGLLICEDIWVPGAGEALADAGAQILIAPHGSPFRMTAAAERLDAVRDRVKATGLPVLFVNQLAGQDEIVFDGASFVMDRHGDVAHRMPQFEKAIAITRWRADGDTLRCIDGPIFEWSEGPELMYRAVTMAVRDYVQKNGFRGVVIGLSGGVDSALTAAIAVDALGAENVRCIMMPSRFTSEESLEDAKACAALLGVDYRIVGIEPGVAAFDEMLAPAFGNREKDVTEENIQSRLRGALLMAFSNKFGDMVLTTGNKSEMSVGYATLYGDMNGGFNPLKDIYKLDVFRLCRWRNSAAGVGLSGPSGRIIPERIIEKPPSAELRDGQRDDDSLPAYEILDPILERLVEGEKSVSEIVDDGFDRAVVKRIEHLLYVAEYKRRQAPPGPKVTSVNFGRDRRYPITNGWRDN